MSQEWIGVDLDGTLAHYEEWRPDGSIGEPIPLMMERVRGWLTEGKTVKIFTARAPVPGQLPIIQAWLERHGLPGLEVTNAKDLWMTELWDDRCVQVIRNTGLVVRGGAWQR